MKPSEISADKTKASFQNILDAFAQKALMQLPFADVLESLVIVRAQNACGMYEYSIKARTSPPKSNETAKAETIDALSSFRDALNELIEQCGSAP